MFLLFVVADVEKALLGLTYSDLLFFSTGIERTPPGGFPAGEQPSLGFLHGTPTNNRFNYSLLPKANTCLMQLLLPTLHPSYDKFEEAMVMGVKNTQGYGFA